MRRRISSPHAVLALPALTALLAGVVLPSSARTQGLPTLEDLGVYWVSDGGRVQLGFAGRLDLEGYVPDQASPWLIPSTDPFATGRLRLFSDLFVGDRVYGLVELRADGGEAPAKGELEARVEQAFLRLTAAPWLSVQAGKFASPFGSYPTRHHTDADPLIRPPLPYEWRTMVSSLLIPENSTRFVGWKDDPAQFRAAGAPPIWGAPYQWGAQLSGVAGPLDYAVAAVNSAPSSEPEDWAWDGERMRRPSWVFAVGWRVAPWLRLSAWHDRGPYLSQDATGPLVGDAEIWDYDQVLWGGEAVWTQGHTTARVEAFHDRWEVPNVAEDPIDVSYSVEVEQGIGTGLHVAARWGAIHFNEIAFTGLDYDGTRRAGVAPWDHATRRLQLGAGWRVVRNAGARLEYMRNDTHGPDPGDDLLSLQLWWEF